MATAGVAIVCNLLASRVPGLGACVGDGGRRIAAVAPIRRAAYISGSLGTLIGADLLNLGKIQGLGAPVASIGGAGTFDGIFLTGIVAVLLASYSRNPYRR